MIGDKSVTRWQRDSDEKVSQEQECRCNEMILGKEATGDENEGAEQLTDDHNILVAVCVRKLAPQDDLIQYFWTPR